MIRTLKEALELRERQSTSKKECRKDHHIPQVTIEREVRFYAHFGGVRYDLHHDWEVEQLDRYIEKCKEKAR